MPVRPSVRPFVRRTTRRSRCRWVTGIVASATLFASPLAVGSVSALGDPPDPMQDAAIVHRLVFEIDLETFAILADDNLDGDVWLDWTTDWCSAPLVGSIGRTFDFRLPCRRHDFAYRNTKLLDARYGCRDRRPGSVCRDVKHGRWWNTRSRAEIDHRFRSDMRDTCSDRVLIQRPRCLMWSEIFYRAVRVAGGP